MRIHKCPCCNLYTLKDACPKCNSVTRKVRPAKFSPEDKYGKYRRMMKEEQGIGSVEE